MKHDSGEASPVQNPAKDVEWTGFVADIAIRNATRPPLSSLTEGAAEADSLTPLAMDSGSRPNSIRSAPSGVVEEKLKAPQRSLFHDASDMVPKR